MKDWGGWQCINEGRAPVSEKRGLARIFQDVMVKQVEGFPENACLSPLFAMI